MSPLILPVLEIGKTIIDRFIPDATEKQKAELDMVRMLQEGELKTVLAQLEINAKEAAHPSIFVAGWRPFVGWGCGFGLIYASILHNVFAWVAVIKGWPEPPKVDSEILIYTLGGLLGIAGLRTIEKNKGVTK